MTFILLEISEGKNIVTTIMKSKEKLIGHLIRKQFYHKHLGGEDNGKKIKKKTIIFQHRSPNGFHFIPIFKKYGA